MKAFLKISVYTAVLLLVSCSSQEVKQEEVKATQPAEESKQALPEIGKMPPLKRSKQGKDLHLVRIMDGAACKNSLEGAKGVFLLYADQNDIERIKKTEGVAIFKKLETQILDISQDAFQNAIDLTNLASDPFSLGADADQEKMAQQLSEKFGNGASAAIHNFEKETSLTIDLAAFPPSFTFYTQGCNVSELNAEISEADGDQRSQ